MFKNTFQSGFLSILYSLGYVAFWFLHFTILFRMLAVMMLLTFFVFRCFFFIFRSKPLQIWDKEGTCFRVCSSIK